MARIASRIRHEVGQYPAHPDTRRAEHHRFEFFVLKARLVLTISVAALVTTQISEPFLRTIADVDRVVGVAPALAESLEKIGIVLAVRPLVAARLSSFFESGFHP